MQNLVDSSIQHDKLVKSLLTLFAGCIASMSIVSCTIFFSSALFFCYLCCLYCRFDLPFHFSLLFSSLSKVSGFSFEMPTMWTHEPYTTPSNGECGKKRTAFHRSEGVILCIDCICNLAKRGRWIKATAVDTLCICYTHTHTHTWWMDFVWPTLAEDIARCHKCL